MLEIYSTVHRHISIKLNLQNSTFETAHLKQLPRNTFVSHANFEPVKISQKHKPIRLGPSKSLQNLSDVTYELMAQDGFAFHRNHSSPNYPNEPVIFPNLRQYHSTPPLLNNTDTESYRRNHSNSLPPDSN